MAAPKGHKKYIAQAKRESWSGVAAKQEGFDFIGIEMNEEYFEIAKRRINQSSERW